MVGRWSLFRWSFFSGHVSFCGGNSDSWRSLCKPQNDKKNIEWTKEVIVSMFFFSPGNLGKMKPFLDLRGVAKQKLSTIATNLYLEQRSDFFQNKMPPENTPWTHLQVSYLEQIKIFEYRGTSLSLYRNRLTIHGATSINVAPRVPVFCCSVKEWIQMQKDWQRKKVDTRRGGGTLCMWICVCIDSIWFICVQYFLWYCSL